MRDGRDILNPGDKKAGPLQGADSRFTAAARAFNKNLHLPQSVYHRLTGGITGRHLGRIGRAFAGTLKAGGAGASPGQGIALWVGKGYDSIIKAGLYVSPAGRNYFTFPPPGFSFPLLWHPILLVPM